MVRHYKAKCKRSLYTEGQLQLAINSVIKDGKSINSAADENHIPRSTLQLKLKEMQDEISNENLSKKHLSGFQKTFSAEQEEALYNYIIKMERQFLGLSSTEVRRLAYDYAEKLKILHNFNHEQGLAGKDWFMSFMTRHQLSCRKAEHTSKARVYGFNRQSVNKFYDLLEETIKQKHIKSEDIYNVDETGISVVPKSAPRVVASKGQKQVSGLSAAERGETVTAEICISASGKFMPPMLIFPRVKENPEFSKNAPPGAWAEFAQSGWMTEQIFTKWFVKFIEFSNPSPDKPVLLLLDGHASHTKNLKVIELAIENNVTILCFPPHCTHKMQPLDVAFMKPLSQRYTEEVTIWQRSSPMTLKNVFEVFGKAFLKAAKLDTAVSAFSATGIVPINRNVFSESDFVTPYDSSSSTQNSSQSVSKKLVEKYSNVIEELQSSNSTPTFSQEENHLSNSKQANSNSSPALSQEENRTLNSKEASSSPSEISIPVHYIIQAKPLITLLNSSLQLVDKVPDAPEQKSISVQETNIQLNQLDMISSVDVSSSDNISSTPKSRNSQDKEFILQPVKLTNLTNFTTQGNGETNTASSLGLLMNDPKAKPKSRKGKTAVITSEEYKNDLVAQKLKTIKKEPTGSKRKASKSTKKVSENSKPKIISNVAGNFNLNTSSTKKRKTLKNKTEYSVDEQVFNVPFVPQQSSFYQQVFTPWMNPIQVIEVPPDSNFMETSVLDLPIDII